MACGALLPAQSTTARAGGSGKLSSGTTQWLRWPPHRLMAARPGGRPGRQESTAANRGQQLQAPTCSSASTPSSSSMNLREEPSGTSRPSVSTCSLRGARRRVDPGQTSGRRSILGCAVRVLGLLPAGAVPGCSALGGAGARDARERWRSSVVPDCSRQAVGRMRVAPRSAAPCGHRPARGPCMKKRRRLPGQGLTGCAWRRAQPRRARSRTAGRCASARRRRTAGR